MFFNITTNAGGSVSKSSGRCAEDNGRTTSAKKPKEPKFPNEDETLGAISIHVSRAQMLTQKSFSSSCPFCSWCDLIVTTSSHTIGVAFQSKNHVELGPIMETFLNDYAPDIIYSVSFLIYILSIRHDPCPFYKSISSSSSKSSTAGSALSILYFKLFVICPYTVIVLFSVRQIDVRLSAI